MNDDDKMHLRRLLNYVSQSEYSSFITSGRDPNHMWNDILALWLFINADKLFVPLSHSTHDDAEDFGHLHDWPMS
jgi:hypothetical protein